MGQQTSGDMARDTDRMSLAQLLSGDIDEDEASQRLLARGADPEALGEIEELIRVVTSDPTIRDRALLLAERTRWLAERADRGARASTRLRVDADLTRDASLEAPGALGDLWRHELATPLTVVDLALETLSGLRHDPAVVDQTLEVARRNVRAAIHLLEGLGSLEDLRVGRIELSWEMVDLGALVHACVDDVRGVVAAQRTVDVVVEQPVNVPADQDAVRQVLVNLLTNAAKFSPARSHIGLTVTVTAEHAEVAVRDRGRGIAPGDVKRVFEAGRRLDIGVPGTGLGLFVARQLARAHGGELLVEHPDDGGTRFVLRLPRSPAAWQDSLERRERAASDRDVRHRRRVGIADAREAALVDREHVADERDAALDDRDALADDRDALADERDSDDGRGRSAPS